MIVGVPREIKAHEYRVAMLPVGVEELGRAGHRVLIASAVNMHEGKITNKAVARTFDLEPTQFLA